MSQVIHPLLFMMLGGRVGDVNNTDGNHSLFVFLLLRPAISIVTAKISTTLTQHTLERDSFPSPMTAERFLMYGFVFFNRMQIFNAGFESRMQISVSTIV